MLTSASWQFISVGQPTAETGRKRQQRERGLTRPQGRITKPVTYTASRKMLSQSESLAAFVLGS